MDLRDVAENHTGAFFKFSRAIQTAISIATPGRDGSTTPSVLVYYGPSGTGKTATARTKFPDAYVLPKGDGKIWWEGYNGQTVVLIDEFYGWIQYDYLLRLLDYSPMQVEFKGGSRPLAATTFIITSNKHWTDWYSDEVKAKHNNLEALQRRLAEFGEVYYVSYWDKDRKEATMRREHIRDPRRRSVTPEHFA